MLRGEPAFLCDESAFLCDESARLWGESAFLWGESARLCGFLCGFLEAGRESPILGRFFGLPAGLTAPTFKEGVFPSAFPPPAGRLPEPF